MRKRRIVSGVEVRSFAEAMGATVFATTSRRTGPKATVALKKGLGPCCYLHEWQPDRSENPYLAYLALADILIVTGESESMLADAAATGNPSTFTPSQTTTRSVDPTERTDRGSQ
jgi:mitochondrial fission protein ELM1